MRHLMWPAFERAGLPEALLFGIMAKESNGKVHVELARGRGGPDAVHARHRPPLRPGPGRHRLRHALRPAAVGRWPAPRTSTSAWAQLNRSIELALAAYNGGEGRALRVYNGSGGRGFWDAAVYNQFPAETQDYVPMVIAAAWLFLHPKQYGLDFPKVDAQPGDAASWREPASIYELTICLGNGGTRDGYMRALRNLNPRYEADSWIPAGTHAQRDHEDRRPVQPPLHRRARARTWRATGRRAMRIRRSCASATSARRRR